MSSSEYVRENGSPRMLAAPAFATIPARSAAPTQAASRPANAWKTARSTWPAAIFGHARSKLILLVGVFTRRVPSRFGPTLLNAWHRRQDNPRPLLLKE